MRTSLFSFDLPDRLIAQEPPEVRGTSRLMVLERNRPEAPPVHSEVGSLTDFIEPGTLMIFNDTRVRKARMIGKNAETGGKGEFLFLSSDADGIWDCVVDKAKKKRPGQKWIFPGGVAGTIVGSPATDRRTLELVPAQTESWFEEHGHIPLPPYMKRPDRPEDAKRYQTVYARETGSAAAPTAGLHFTPGILDGLEAAGIEKAWVTLRVGLGTFAPVRTEEIEDHPMHSEGYFVPKETAEAVDRAKSEGRKVLAVGTTAVRTLEASWNGESLATGPGETDLFVYPGYEFGVVDQMFTNFHTPNSSLLMLVSAFCGRERLLEAYRIAVEKEYRFFSYGDAMLIR
jgi:S-adenosylmethionine:tRNA ribosyltransferase-isomerase